MSYCLSLMLLVLSIFRCKVMIESRQVSTK